MTNNRLNGCEYCMAAHSTISQMAGVDPHVVDPMSVHIGIIGIKPRDRTLNRTP
uniref:hypothetical protein n=1 Tax=Roseobacter weihaiensis TaxID=2763262 RepID=UPI002221C105|nr:hypothetical protein [Roseobacter sp. H9]